MVEYQKTNKKKGDKNMNNTLNPKPYSEEWWIRLDIRNMLKKAVKRSKKK